MKKIIYLLVLSFMFFWGTDYVDAYNEYDLGIIGTRCYYRNSNGDLSFVVQKNDSDPNKSTIYLLKGYKKDQYGENQSAYAKWEDIDTPSDMKKGLCPDTLAYTIRTGKNRFQFKKTSATSDNEHILYNHDLEEGKNRCVYSINNMPDAGQIFYYVDDKTAVGYKLDGSNFQLIYQDYLWLDGVSYTIFEFSDFLSSYKQNGGKCPDIYLGPYQGLFVDSEEIPEKSSKIYYNSSLTSDNDKDEEEDSKEETNSRSLYFNYNGELFGITSPFTVQVVLDSSNIFSYRVYFNGNKPSLNSDLQKVDNHTYIVNHDGKTLYFYWRTGEEYINKLKRAFDDTTGNYKLYLNIERVTESANYEYLITPIEENNNSNNNNNDNNDDNSKVDGNVCDVIITPAIGEKINWIFNLIKYGGTLLAIMLSMFEFMKAVGSDEDNATKKASERLIKRLIAAAIIFLIPLFLQFIFNTIEIPGIITHDPTCGIGVSN